MSATENVNKSIIVRYLSTAFASQLFWIVSFSILTAFAAQIAVPVQPVPFTMQTFMVLLAGAFLGARNGALSQILYLTMGVIGLPVFAQTPDGLIGIARIFGPTGGYLLSFPLAAFIVGYFIEKNKGYLSTILSMFAANIFILLFGSLYLGLFFRGGILEGIKLGAAIFSVWMVIKVFLAASLFASTSNKYKKLPVNNS
ncbi:MAG TPA: biotin transporter BioY [Ignavibacteria bacterium]|nr:biotin transporter BioY [Ignavibacteria bacterium]